VVRLFGLGGWMGEGKVEGEESRGWVGLDFRGGFQYNTGWFGGRGSDRVCIGRLPTLSAPVKTDRRKAVVS